MTKEVLLLVPTKLTRPFFMQLHEECEAEIYTRFRDDWRPITRGVPRDGQHFNPASVIAVLDREFRQSNSISLLVVAPTSSKRLEQAIAEVAKQTTIPVIALSLPFQHRGVFKRLGIPVPPCVVSDSAKGSSQLAEAAAMELASRRPLVTSPTVVLVRGAEHRIDSIHRLRHFKQGLLDSRLSPKIHLTPPCDWQRDPAYDAMMKVIDHVTTPIDIVFAANDDMALGVRDAIRDSYNRGVANNALVYGFDAIPEVRSLIDDDDFHLRGTVAQDLHGMAVALCDLIATSQHRPLTIKDTVPVDPITFLPEATTARLQIKRNWPKGIPPLDLKSNPREWISATETADRYGILESTIGDYRKTGKQGGRTARDAHGKLGIDRWGRV